MLAHSGSLHGLQAKPMPATSRRGPPSRLGTRRLSTVCLMGGYQYQRRVNKLRQRGLEVLEFGSRVLEEQCYGEDVVSLQLFLGEQGYLNLMDGITGYFGSVTKEALMNWQRDAGLPVTGVFTQDCRWSYLQQQEAKATEAAMPVVSVPVAAPQASFLSASPLATAPAWQIWLGAAALAAAAFYNLNRPGTVAAAGQHRGPAPDLLPMLKQALLGSLRALAGAAGTAVMLALAVARGLLLGALRVLGASAAAATMISAAVGQLVFTVLRAATSVTVAAVVAVAGVASVAASDVAAVLATVREELRNAGRLRGRQMLAVAPAARRPQQTATPIATRVVPEADPRAARAAARVPAAPSRAAQAPAAVQGRPGAAASESRMSDAELQKHLAAMKGDGRTSVQQPTPRPLPQTRQPGGDPFLHSKYGKYYGGQETREQIREFLEERNPPAPNNGPARRMQALGYPIPGKRSAPKTPRQTSAASPPAAQPAGRPAAAARPQPSLNPRAAAPIPQQQLSPLAGGAARPAFEDVAVPEPAAVPRSNGTSTSALFSVPAASRGLLAGTELESVSELPPRPVKVRRPGSIDDEPPAAAAAEVAAQPWRVPVVKQGPATVGEMMQASTGEPGREEEEPVWQGPLYAPGPAVAPEALALPAGTVVAKGPIPVLKPARLAQGGGARDAELAQWR